MSDKVKAIKNKDNKPIIKEFWVKIKYPENDEYNELWITNKGTYFARHTYHGGVWYFVGDPLGFCELSHLCPEDYVFHVCDDSWNELFISTNNDDSCSNHKFADFYDEGYKLGVS